MLGGGVKTAAIAFSKICGSLEGWQSLRIPSPFLLKKGRFAVDRESREILPSRDFLSIRCLTASSPVSRSSSHVRLLVQTGPTR
ncbi:hypothetical protein EV291_1734 [Rhizobium sp. BK068]|nr:hypothetical protein EV291_1734 [Rhizobium sp. BK068]